MKLTPHQASVLRQIWHSSTHSDDPEDWLNGWKECPKPHSTPLQFAALGDLIQFSADGSKVRVTEKGQAVIEWAT